jgi:ketosteroid isomerase-like protein
MNSKILELEERLRFAMCNSDIDELDNLLADNLIFTNHLGQVVSKTEDLESHRKRIFVICSVSLSNQKIIDLGDSAVVTTQAEISGSYNGQPTAGKFRFTRVWSNNGIGWQVVVGHSCIIV